MLSSIGTSRSAKAASYIHLLFNVIGSVIFTILAVLYFKFVNPVLGNSNIDMVGISVVHTGFNLLNTILMFPFANGLVFLAEKMTLRSKTTPEEEEQNPVHLDDRILSTPSIAIENCIKEIVRLGNMSYKNLMLSCDALISKDMNDVEKVLEREKNIDSLTQSITAYMVKLCNEPLTERENATVTSLFHTVNDMERIGDHCENLAETVQYLSSDNLEFSEHAKENIASISLETQKSVRNAIIALSDNDIDFAEKVIKEEDRVDRLEQNLRDDHIKRLSQGICDPLVGVAFLDVLTNLERVSDHALNVAQSVINNNVKAA